MPTLKVRRGSQNINLLILAVAYYRMSSDKQDKSIDEQRHAVETWATAHGYKIIREYKDEGISGDNTAKRKDFQRMMADAEGGEFQAILCWNQDRFGRFDSIEAGRWIYPLRENNIHLATVGQGIIAWDDFQSRMMYSIQQESKHQFLRDLSRDTTRGLIRKAERGEWVTGSPPFGYQVKEVQEEGKTRHRLALANGVETSLVMRIYDDYENGASLRGLRDNLNAAGKNPRTGSLWNENAIKRILTNPVYTGDFIWPMASYGRYHRVRDKQVSSEKGDIGEQVIIANNHPALISREQFERVGKRLEENRGSTTPLAKGGDFVLSGLVHCVDCGHKMYGFTNSKGPYKYYRCSGNTHYGKALCGTNNVPQDQLLNAVFARLGEWAADPETREGLIADINAIFQQSTSCDNVELLEARRDEIDKKLKRAEERILIVDDDMVPAIQRQVRELRSERQTIIENLKATKLPAESVKQRNADEIIAALKSVQNLEGLVTSLLKAGKPHEARALISRIVERIDVKIIKEPQGKRFRYRLDKGNVRIAPQLLQVVTGSSQRGGLT